MRRLLLFGLATLWANLTLADSISVNNNILLGSQNYVQIKEPRVPLTLKAAQDLAIKTSPDILVAQRELEASMGTVIQAKSSLNPEVQLYTQDVRPQTRQSMVQITQPIETNGKRAARIEAAQSKQTIAQVELQAKKLEIISQVEVAFYRVLALQEQLNLSQSSLELAQHVKEVTIKRVRAGKISPVEATKSRIAESSAKIEVNQAQTDLINARKALSSLWANTSPQFDRATGQIEQLPTLPFHETLLASLTRSPAIQRLNLEIEQRQALYQIERSKRVPDVSIILGVQRNQENGLNQPVLGLSMPIPVFDTNRGNIQESASRIDKAKEESRSLQLKLINELTSNSEQFKKTRLEIDSLKNEILPDSQQAYNAATKGFELGKFNFLDVLDAQRTLFQAKSQYIKALMEAHRLIAEISRLTGEDLMAISFKEGTYE